MPVTASGWPYPTSTDTPDVPRDIAALAAALEGHAPYKLLRGVTANVATLAPGAGTQWVIDLTPGGFTKPPIVLANVQTNGYLAVNACANPASLTAGFVRAFNVSTSANSNVSAEWWAIQWTP